MVMTIAREQRQAAEHCIITQIKQGASVQQARATIDLPMHRATIYHLLKRVRTEGDTAFSDGRHGHPIKLRGEARTFLIEFCQASPHTPSLQVQTALQERFGFTISVSQINRVRAALGLSNRSIRREKKPEASTSTEIEWQDSVGSLLLLAAATETGLLAQFAQALPKDVIQFRSSRLSNGLSTSHRLLLTLLFLGVVGLRRTRDLRGYTGDGLALLTGRKRAYGYRYAEEFLTCIAGTGRDEDLTDPSPPGPHFFGMQRTLLPLSFTWMGIASLSTRMCSSHEGWWEG